MKNRKIKKRSQLLATLIVVVALFGVLAINANFASAGQTSETPVVKAKTVDDAPYGGFASTALPSLLKVGLALVVVVIGIYFGVFLLKKMMGRKYSGNKKHNILEVLETTYIGPKKSISLIKVADKSVLVASTESSISLLTEMDSAATLEIVEQMTVEEDTDQFSDLFKTASEKIKEFTIKRETKALVDMQPDTKG